ncbi:MAG TPA: sulfatase [Verrucomicrobiae bacterium]|nr:sulfatase [Verrucomicrobiae bacterium]
MALGLVCLAGGSRMAASAATNERPNIVFILADDLAWNDLGCTGGRLWDTPNLDRLAAQSLRFTEAYAPAPICSASRAALLTGRSPARLHLEFVTKGKGVTVKAAGLPLRPPPFTELSLGETTYATVLDRAGIHTGFFGKWHVAQHYQRYLGWSPTRGPRQFGFEEAIEDFGGHTYGALADAPVEGPTNVPPGEFPDDSMTDKAIAFLEANRARPFCLTISHFFVHEPVKAPARWLFEKYQRRYGDGNPKHAAYGAFVETLDHHIGRVLAALDRLNLSRNTVVVFTSDNGGAPGYAALAPLRGCKWSLYEAGVRVPLMVRWPGVVRAGSRCDTPVIGTDLFPTFAEIEQASLDPGIALDGQSLLPLLRGEPAGHFADRDMFWHFPYYTPEPPKRGVRRPVGINPPPDTLFKPASAIRHGGWVLVHDYETDRDELYDLTADPGEQHDVAAVHPEEAQTLRTRLMNYLRSVQARLPEPNPGEKR